eukprot:gb/GEZN01008194.1/.p1 GENE.gb/GEZN01008194.1/~~gb/GEZN01008194.1/.p1  ORF type:complete len:355 (+),score=22.79 gb/GEZN01008194.1/:107-1171(+)
MVQCIMRTRNFRSVTGKNLSGSRRKVQFPRLATAILLARLKARRKIAGSPLWDSADKLGVTMMLLLLRLTPFLYAVQWSPANRCDFMEVQCGQHCCKFMETCSPNGGCCPFGQEHCGSGGAVKQKKEKLKPQPAAITAPPASIPPASKEPKQPKAQKAQHCDFMQVQCGSTCCGFMESCSPSGVCCKFGEDVCGDGCCSAGTFCGGGKCVPDTCENRHTYSCRCDKEKLTCKQKGDTDICATALFKCMISPSQHQVQCKCAEHGAYTTFIDSKTEARVLGRATQEDGYDTAEVTVPAGGHFLLYSFLLLSTILGVYSYYQGYLASLLTLTKKYTPSSGYDSTPLSSKTRNQGFY